MYLEILGANCSYNSYLANLYGLETAVYISTLIKLYEEQSLKTNPIDPTILDRNYIQKITSLTPSKQLSCQDILVNEKIITEVNSRECILFHISTLYGKFDLDSIKKKQIKEETKIETSLDKESARKEKYFYGLKKCITPVSELIDQLLLDWISCILDKFGYMNGAQVRTCQEELAKFAKNNLTIYEDVIKIAIKNCYRDIQWAIKIYEQEHKYKPAKPLETIVPETRRAKVSGELIF